MKPCLEIPLCDLCPFLLGSPYSPCYTNTKISSLHLPPGPVKLSPSGFWVNPIFHNWVKCPNEFHWFRSYVCQHWGAHDLDGVAVKWQISTDASFKGNKCLGLKMTLGLWIFIFGVRYKSSVMSVLWLYAFNKRQICSFDTYSMSLLSGKTRETIKTSIALKRHGKNW